jgi:type III restriction enzyme
MNPHVNAISNRLSLRQPQRDALEILDRVCEIVKPEKDTDLAQALDVIRSEFPSVTDFERDFPSLCFALATGVGKTRLMGAFITYLFRSEQIRHFFVLAPNLTIYNKLIADFTPNTPKYVFQGIAEFATNPPEIITGDNYESGIGVRNDHRIQRRMFDTSPIHINIFNISKINSEVRGDKAPRIKRLSEYVGESYFEYLSKLDDLVLLMDESHRYRASAGVKAINELKPILGLELTATPHVEKGGKSEPFRNVIFSYPLSKALTDGFVKEPAVATRENFDAANYTKDSLEILKLEDGVRVHEETKAQLDLYARENQKPRVKPFMLVVAQDTDHANALVKRMEADEFFGGNYRGRVITVHSNLKGEEKDDTVEQLLTVEHPDNPTEIVVHVNMLKEGWDVTNLYTIVPLRAANSKTLVEQSIGRGLRLPYGKRVGVPAVDRLTIVSHDKFQEIIDEANRPDSIIRTGIIIGKDIPDKKTEVVEIKPTLAARLFGTDTAQVSTPTTPTQKRLFDTPKQQLAAQYTLAAITDIQRLPRAADLLNPEIQRQIVEKVKIAIAAAQPSLPGMDEEIDVAKIVKETSIEAIELSILIPRIIVVPRGEVTSGYRDFDLDVRAIRYQPVAQEILIQHLHDHERHRLFSGARAMTESRLEDYLVFGLIDYDDVSYDEDSALLYKLCGQCVAHLKSYLPDDDAVLNVIHAHQRELVRAIHAQMEEHYEENASEYEVKVSQGFKTLRSGYATTNGEKARDFRSPVDERQMIRGMLFNGFKRCLFQEQKFDSDSERRLSVILENERIDLKWLKPHKGDFNIRYNRNDDEYIPDFVVETPDAIYLIEPKRASEMDDPEVIAKAKAAALWCHHASQHGEKPWTYLLIPHDAIDESKTLAGLTATYRFPHS